MRARRCSHPRRTTIRSTRSARYPYEEFSATSRTTLNGPCWTCRGTSRTAPRAERCRRRRHRLKRPAWELYDLDADPAESRSLHDDPEYAEVAEDLALRLHAWREQTADVIPSEFVGTRISDRYTHTYALINGLTLPSRYALSEDRGIDVARNG